MQTFPAMKSPRLEKLRSFATVKNRIYSSCMLAVGSNAFWGFIPIYFRFTLGWPSVKLTHATFISWTGPKATRKSASSFWFLVSCIFLELHFNHEFAYLFFRTAPTSCVHNTENLHWKHVLTEYWTRPSLHYHRVIVIPCNTPNHLIWTFLFPWEAIRMFIMSHGKTSCSVCSCQLIFKAGHNELWLQSALCGYCFIV